MSLAAISYDPIVHLELGPLRVSPHGIGIAVGFLAGVLLLLPETRRKAIPDDDVYTFLTWGAIGAVVGARAAYVLNHLSEFDSILQVLRVWEGGISLLGGIFGGVLAAVPAMRARGYSFWHLMDLAAPSLALGIAVGRVGDLVVADHLGKPTSFFLGYRCPVDAATASPCPPGAVVHQTALYDLLAAASLLAVLLLLRRRMQHQPPYDGFFLFVFGAGYGTARLIEDFLREDLRRFGLTGSQVTATITLALCLWMLTIVRRTPRVADWSGRNDGIQGTPSMTGQRNDREE